MKKCLLIGGAGFIGSNLAKILSTSYNVSIVDCLDTYDSSLRISNYYKRDFFNGELEDDLLVDMDMVILLSCSVGPKTSMESPDICYNTDVIALIKLLDQMKKVGCSQLVFVSSGGTVYGEHTEALLNEDMQTFPINHYGIMKLTQEKIILMYNSKYNMNNIIFRLSNPYGEGQRISSGIGAITAILNNVINNQPIHIWGDGTVVRDYIHIDDAVDMMSRFLDQTDCGPTSNAVYNIGTGVGSSINNLISIAEKITGQKADVRYEAARNEDVKSNVLDITKIQKYIGDYKCISVEEGMQKYYDYICSHNAK